MSTQVSKIHPDDLATAKRLGIKPHLCDERGCGTIYVGEGSKPLSVQPCPYHFNTYEDYMRASYTHKDTLSAACCTAFQKAFSKAIKALRS